MRLSITSDDTSAQASGVEQSGSFGIASNAKAFRVLSDTIYQDKPGSMIRETACNGLDSHIQNGNPETPIRIHLPDQFEPFYSIRDFGMGMSPDTIRNVFCVYFSSTKEQSNDVIGAFGLGAKTPFAYTDKFTVVSIWNGVKYTYAAYTADDGAPNMDLMLEEPTDEHNGVEIIVPVVPSDFRTFQESTKTQLRFFPVKPEIINANGFKFDGEPEFSLNTESVSVLKSVDRYSDLNRSYIVQGPVGYAIDNSLLLKKVEDAMANNWLPEFSSEDYKFLRAMLNTATWFKFSIGEIGVTASREGVEYTKFTVINILKRVKIIHDEMIAHVEETLQNASSVYERVLLLNRMEGFSELIKHINIDTGNAIKEKYSNVYSFSLQKQKVFNTIVKDSTGKILSNTVNFQITNYSRNYNGGLKSSRVSDITLIPGDQDKKDLNIIFRDTASRPILRLRQYFESNPDINDVILISSNSSIDAFDTLALADKIKDGFGGYDVNIIKLKDCPEPPSNGVVRKRATYQRPTAYRMDGIRSGHDNVSRWTREYVDIDDAEFGMDESGNVPTMAAYVVVERQRITSVHDWALLSNLYRANMMDIPVYGIRSTDIEKLSESSINWIPLDEYTSVKRKEVRKCKTIRRASYAQDVLHHIRYSTNEYILNLDTNARELKCLRKIISSAKNILENSDVNSYAKGIANHSLPTKFIERINNLSESFRNKTPLLKSYHDSRYTSVSENDVDHVTAYINWAVCK